MTFKKSKSFTRISGYYRRKTASHLVITCFMSGHVVTHDSVSCHTDKCAVFAASVPFPLKSLHALSQGLTLNIHQVSCQPLKKRMQSDFLLNKALGELAPKHHTQKNYNCNFKGFKVWPQLRQPELYR